MFSASSVRSENSRHFATASPGFPQPRPQGAFLQSQGKAPWGRGWVSREIKPVMGSRNVGYFPCQAPQASLPHPTGTFFLSKKTCRNTIGSPATRNQCELVIRRKIQLTWAFCLGLQTTAAEEELYTENFSRFE